MINDKHNYTNFYSHSPGHSYGEPNKIVALALNYIKNGKVLDLGAGDGRHSVFLAKKGFEVTAVDTSTVALEKLHRIASTQNVSVETICADLGNWSINRPYDVIIAIAIFQHLSSKVALSTLNSTKTHTNPDGLNVIILFTRSGDRYLLDRKTDPDAFYPEDGWLKEFYKDWEVLVYEEEWVPLIGKTNNSGKPLKNIVAKMIARKRSSS